MGTRIAPPGKLPALPRSLSQPHAFNPSGRTMQPIHDDEEDEETRDEEQGQDEEGRPLSSAAVIGRGAAILGGSGGGEQLSKLIKKRSELIRSTNIKDIPRLMDKDPEEEGMTVTATSSANIVETSFGDEHGQDFEEEPVSPAEAQQAAEPEEPEVEEPDYEAEDYEEEYEEEFEASPPPSPGPPEGMSEADRVAAAGKIQAIARGRQGRKKAREKKEWKVSSESWKPSGPSDEEREAAARNIHRIARGRQGKKRVDEKRAMKAKGHFRSDMTSGGTAAEELERQRAVLKIQALSRGKQSRSKTKATKESYKADPSKKPKGYKQFSEYDGDGKDNPYFTKLAKGKKNRLAGDSAGNVYGEQDYTYTHKEAALRIQAAQRGKMGRRKAKKKKEGQ